MRLKWEKLLCDKRQRQSEANRASRTCFDMDYDRIIYSSSLRRLQDKAQVFPLQENDFTRTRLTHSIEASSLGRSFGVNIGDWLLSKGDFTSDRQVRELSSLLAVACLVHDLGNPPFGHYGEDIIRKWFKNWFGANKWCHYKDLRKNKKINKQEARDLITFDGNAQNIRILSKLQLLNDFYGVNFTFGTLSTLIKYPYSSLENKKKKKIGYFESEQELVSEIRKHTGLFDNVRHPATFLLEAADDIAYLASDVEDGVKKRLVPWDKIYNEIRGECLCRKDHCTCMFKAYSSGMSDFIVGIENIMKDVRKNGIPDESFICAQNFRVRAQGKMFLDAVQAFKDNYDKIMEGVFDDELIKHSNSKDLAQLLRDIAVKYCYNSEEVMTLELVGDSTLSHLLDLFVPAIVYYENTKQYNKSKDGKLYELISSNFKCIAKKNGSFNLYDRLQLAVDFISGMTDSYAVNLNKRLTGTMLP